MVRMADGSLIEMSERAGFSLDAAPQGEHHPARARPDHRPGRQAARPPPLRRHPRRRGLGGRHHLRRQQRHQGVPRVGGRRARCTCSRAPRLAVLHPGDQVTTHASVERVPVKDEVAWSRNAKEYDQLLAELTALGKDIDARVARPGLRYSTRLLDLAPEGTTIWIALPNLSKSLAETQKILDEKISREPVAGPVVDRTPALDRQRAEVPRDDREARRPGPEPGRRGRGGDDARRRRTSAQPVLLAEVTNEASFRATVAAGDRRAAATGQGGMFVDDPATAPATGDAMLLWIHNGLFVASPSGAELRKVAAVIGRRRQSVHSRAPSTAGSPRTTRTAPAGCSRPTSTRWWPRARRRRPPRSSRRPRSWASSTSTSSSSTAGRSTAGPRPAPPSPSTRRGGGSPPGWPRRRRWGP